MLFMENVFQCLFLMFIFVNKQLGMYLVLFVVDVICLNNVKVVFFVEFCCLILFSMCLIFLFRCIQEMYEVFQMVMIGYVCILDQYVELQEKYIFFLFNMCEICYGVIEYKKEVKNFGMNCVEDYWFDV